MKKIVSIVLAVMMVLAAISVVLVQPISAVEGKTKVTFRIVPAAGWRTYSGAMIQLMVYSDAEGNDIVEELSFKARRIDSWQVTIPVDTGLYYKIASASIENDMLSPYIGKTEIFQAVGSEMTVYCGIQNVKGEAPDMPNDWCVVGEDTQNFGIWAPETSEANSNETLSGDDSSDPHGEQQSGSLITPLPEQNTDVIPVNNENDSETKYSETNNINKNEEKLSAKIGDIIVICIVGAIVVTCVVSLFIIKKRKKQVK